MKLVSFPSTTTMKAICRGICTALIAALATVASAADVTIQPDEEESKDTFAYSFLTGWGFDTDSTGFGSAFGGLLSAGATSSGAHDTVSFLEFELDALEELELTGSDVTEARLYLYVGNTSSAGFGANPSSIYPVDVTLYSVEEFWDESALTWGNAPSYSGAVDAVTINATGYWISFDVTSKVQAWLDGNEDNFGFALEQDAPVSNGSSQVIAVFDSSAATNKPYLKVNY
jgi:hypothetical protein